MARCTVEGHPQSIVPMKNRHPSQWIRFSGGRYDTLDEEELKVLLKTPGVTVDFDPEEPFAVKLHQLQNRVAKKAFKKARIAGKTAGKQLEGKAREINAAAHWLLMQQESFTFLEIRLRVKASAPMIARVLKEMGLRERIVPASGRGGKKIVFERA